MKRVLSLVLVMMLAMGLCACGGGSTSGSKADNEEEAYEIVWYLPGTFGDDLEMVNEKVNEYVKEKINATVKLTSLDWGVYTSKIDNMLSAGEKVDLAWLNGNRYAKYVTDETAIDITDMLGEYAPGTKEALGGFLDGCMIDGKLYAVPANKDKGHQYSIVYRKDIAEKYGFDMSNIKTLRDLYPYFDVIKENEPNMYPFGPSDGANAVHLALTFTVNAGDFVCFADENSDELITRYETEDYREAARIAQEMYNAGYIYQDSAISDKTTEFKNNGQLFSWVIQTQPNKLAEVQATLDYEIGEILMTDVHLDNRDTFGSMMFIPYTSENPERVMKLIELVNTDKYLNNLINFGIEGVHYEKVGENTIRPNKESNYDFIGSQWVLGNTYINYDLENYVPDKAAKLEEWNDSAKRSKYFGFVFDRKPVETEFAACDNVTGKYWKTIAYGTSDPDATIDQMVAELEAAGLNRIKEEAQRQFEEWKQKNNK